MKKYAVLALALMLAIACLPTLAAPAVDDFAYIAGNPLNGQNGGTGWAGAWTSLTPGLFTISTPGLTFPGVVTTGNAVSVGVIQSGFAAADRQLDIPFRYGGLNTVSDFSFLIRPDTSFGQWGSMMLRNSILGTEFGLTTNPATGEQALFIQQGGSGGISSSASVTYVAGTTYLVKAKLTVDGAGAGVLQAWVYDNDPNSNPALATTSMNLIYPGQNYWGGTYSLIELYSAGNYTYDQFRVDPPPYIPEAGTMVALGSFVSMGGLFLRRRFAKS
jgi:hypothetical protein